MDCPDDRPLRVAVLDEEFPYPLTTGKRLRSFHLLARLAKRHTVYYLARKHARPQETQRAVEALRGHGMTPILIDTPTLTKRSLRFAGELLKNLVGKLPVSVQIHSPRAVRRAVAETARALPIDLWHCEWSPLTPSLAGVSFAPQIVMAHNVEAQIWKRVAEHETNPFKARFFRGQWLKFERFERQVFRDRYVVTVSEEDSALAGRIYGAPAAAVIDNGVDGSYFDVPPQTRAPNRLLFLGSLDWRPNLDAIDFLLTQIMPVVSARHPGVRLSIVGRNPPRSLLARAQEVPGVGVHANVVDVKPYLAEAGALVVPLRIGGGSRLKIIEAAAIGLPVITTAVGCEGLKFVADQHLTVADSAEEMAAAIGQCATNYQPFLRRAETARKVARENYDWDQLALELERCWYDALVA